jgi:hypothetical protein
MAFNLLPMSATFCENEARFPRLERYLFLFLGCWALAIFTVMLYRSCVQMSEIPDFDGNVSQQVTPF